MCVLWCCLTMRCVWVVVERIDSLWCDWDLVMACWVNRTIRCVWGFSIRQIGYINNNNNNDDNKYDNYDKDRSLEESNYSHQNRVPDWRFVSRAFVLSMGVLRIALALDAIRNSLACRIRFVTEKVAACFSAWLVGEPADSALTLWDQRKSLSRCLLSTGANQRTVSIHEKRCSKWATDFYSNAAVEIC